IRISLVFAFLVLFEEGYTQSCSLACADTECGELNVAFTPQGGPAFCEGDTITFVNASDPGFNYFIIDWSDGTVDSLVSYASISHEYMVADSLLCIGNGSRLFEVCFKGVKICSTGVSCASGSYDFKLNLRPKVELQLSSQY